METPGALLACGGRWWSRHGWATASGAAMAECGHALGGEASPGHGLTGPRSHVVAGLQARNQPVGQIEFFCFDFT
jgi:hypothetical protein